MSGMNTFLSEAYGTAAPQGHSEQEKVAAAYDFLDKLASADGIDISALSDADVEKVANFYFNKLAEEEAAAEAAPAEEKKEKKEEEATEGKKNELPQQVTDGEKQAMAEMGEADFLGRQMAHAFVQELDTIQKTAMAAQAAAPAEQQIPEALLKIAEERAIAFLQEKVAEGKLCKCGDPACDGKACASDDAETKEAAADTSQIDAIAAQMLAQSGYGRLLGWQ